MVSLTSEAGSIHAARYWVQPGTAYSPCYSKPHEIHRYRVPRQAVAGLAVVNRPLFLQLRSRLSSLKADAALKAAQVLGYWK